MEEANFNVNLLWLIVACIGLMLSIVALIVKSSREAERFENWLKTHEKEIQTLQVDNKAIKESQNQQNNLFISEIRKMESLMGDIKIDNGIIKSKLEILLKYGPSKNDQKHE